MKLKKQGSYRDVPYVIWVTRWPGDAVLESVQVEGCPEAIISHPNSVFPSVESAFAAGEVIAQEVINDSALDPA